jgi:hypothetical protein
MSILPPVLPTPASATPPPPGTFTDAPASCTLKFTLGKVDVLYTLRDTSDPALFTRLQPVLAALEAWIHAGTPTLVPEPPASWCPVHQVTMTQHVNGNGAWWSHRLPDGTWCKGQP